MKSKKKMARVEDGSFIFPKCVLSNPYEILEFYLLIYIKHKGTIRFWSNGLTKVKEKI